jgi:hypothetical protein
VVGAGCVSWELTRQLVKNLPTMVVPKWVSTRTQPIALDDVVRYLAGVIDHPDALGRVFEIGGAEQLTYLEMLQVAAELSKGSRVPIVRVPVLTPRLSSYWLALVTNVDVTTRRNLIDSMDMEVVVTDHTIRDVARRADVVRRVGAARTRRGRALTSQPNSGGSAKSMASDRVTWVSTGARTPPDARRSSPTTIPSSTAAKASITLPVAKVATAYAAVVAGTGCRGMAA